MLPALAGSGSAGRSRRSPPPSTSPTPPHGGLQRRVSGCLRPVGSGPANFLIYEYMRGDWSARQHNPRGGSVRESAEVFEKGNILVPIRPGIGVELNEEVGQPLPGVTGWSSRGPPRSGRVPRTPAPPLPRSPAPSLPFSSAPRSPALLVPLSPYLRFPGSPFPRCLPCPLVPLPRLPFRIDTSVSSDTVWLTPQPLLQ